MSELTSINILDSYLNLTKTLTIGVVGFSTAIAVSLAIRGIAIMINKVAQKFFTYDSETFYSYASAVRAAGAFAAGVATSWALSSRYLQQTRFTFATVATLAAIDLTVFIASMGRTILLLSPGALTGWLGRPGIILTGVISSGIGAYGASFKK